MEIPDNLSVPCPQCATPLDIDWLEVSQFNRAAKDFMPGEVRCPSNPSHDVSAARQELDWPTHLTEEDRAWLREHGRLER